MQRIGIVGFGFCGNLLLANLVRKAQRPMEIYIIDPKLDARGLAFGTRYDAHLLNVRAGNMSAFADAPSHFIDWLATHHPHTTAQDFVPRRHYGDYLESIWQDTQARAAEKKIFLKLVPATAVAASKQGDALALHTERGDAIALDRLVLATGNETKPIAFGNVQVLQTPWAQGALADAAKTPGPILLIGTGLTAVDMVLALRAENYMGEIIAYSRNGLLPHTHQTYMAGALDAAEASHATLRDWAGWLRRKTRAAADWRAVIDGLRPFTPGAWQKLRDRQQRIFFRRAFTYWNIHRHRMAPQIAAQLQSQQADGSLRILNRRQFRALAITPALAINCTGGELDLEKSTNPLLKQMLANRLIEVHGSGLGLACDPSYRPWGEAYPQLYAMGALMTGQLLESTAVPELRVQAASIAESLCKS